MKTLLALLALLTLASSASAQTVAPSSLLFPLTVVGQTSAPKTVQVLNTTANPVIVTIQIVGASFNIASNTCTSPLVAGGACALTLAYAPTAATSSGFVTGALTFFFSSGTTQKIAMAGTTTVSAPLPPPPPVLTCMQQITSAVATQKANDDKIIATLTSQIASAQAAASSAKVELNTPQAPSVTVNTSIIAAPVFDAPNAIVPVPATGAVFFMFPLRNADGTDPGAAGWAIIRPSPTALVATITAQAYMAGNSTGYVRVEEPGKDPVLIPVVLSGTVAGWAPCVAENARCTFTGTKQVRYGQEPTWTIMTFTDGVDCTNAIFGDPLPGVVKSCEVLN